MLSESLSYFLDLMKKGGPLMWVLLAMSIISVSLMIERAWFWLKLNSKANLARVARMEQSLRRGDRATARILSEDDHGVYGRIVHLLLEEDYSDALGASIAESQRSRLERCMGTLSTMITAAPLVGLLGTVSGLIASFKLLADQMTSTDPRSVGLGLSEALLNTAGGLLVTVITIFPYNAFRVQIDRTLGRIEMLLGAAAHMHQKKAAGDAKATPPESPAKPVSSTRS